MRRIAAGASSGNCSLQQDRRRRARRASGALARLSLPSASLTPAASERGDVGACPRRGSRCCAGTARRGRPAPRAAPGRRRRPGRRAPPRAAGAARRGRRRSAPGSAAAGAKRDVPEPARGQEAGPGPGPVAPGTAPRRATRPGGSPPGRPARPAGAAARARRSAARGPRAAARGRAAAPPPRSRSEPLAPGERRLGLRRDPTPGAPGTRRPTGSTRSGGRGARACSRRRRPPPCPQASSAAIAARRPPPRSRRPCAGRGSRRRPRPTARSRPPASGSVPARCDSSRWQWAFTRPGSSTPSPRSRSGRVGLAGVAATTDPDDAAVRNGDDAVTDRGTRDRKQPGRPE